MDHSADGIIKNLNLQIKINPIYGILKEYCILTELVIHPASNIGQYGKEAVRLSFNTPFITYSTSSSDDSISEKIDYSIRAKLYRGNVELNVKEYELYFDVNGDIPKGPENLSQQIVQHQQKHQMEKLQPQYQVQPKQLNKL